MFYEQLQHLIATVKHSIERQELILHQQVQLSAYYDEFRLMLIEHLEVAASDDVTEILITALVALEERSLAKPKEEQSEE